MFFGGSRTLHEKASLYIPYQKPEGSVKQAPVQPLRGASPPLKQAHEEESLSSFSYGEESLLGREGGNIRFREQRPMSFRVRVRVTWFSVWGPWVPRGL